MGKLFLLVTNGLFFSGCYCVADPKSHTSSEISKFSLHYNIYDIRSDGTPFNLITEVDAFFDGEFYLYKIPYMYQLRHENEVVLEEERFHAFVVRSGSPKGYLFDNEADSAKPEFILKDSILNSKGITGLDYYVPEYMKYDTGVEDSDYRVQKYYISLMNNGAHYDSIYACYNKQALGVAYSYSPSLDTSSIFKLYKVVIVSAPYYSDEFKMEVPRREIEFKMIKHNISEAEKKYFSGFINTVKSYK